MKTTFALSFAILLTLLGEGFSESKPEYFASFDPAKGFKPAQRDLTEVYLQLAASLENFGSPEPYLRHMASEHARIESLYMAREGKAPKSFRPAHLTDDYIDRVAANWNKLSPKLGLENYAKQFGHTMRDAIKGTRGTGTIIVDIFNRHQERVFNAMVGKATPTDFEALRVELLRELELDKKEVSEGRYEVARRDAVSYAIIVHGMTMKLFASLDQGLKPADAERVKTVVTKIIMDTGEMAESELRAGLSEWAFSKSSTAAK